MSKRVADLLVETLQAAGVKTCYGIVGDTLNRIAHAIDRSAIDWVHMRHEEAGAFAAAAEALLTGRLTACAGTCGPGSLHFINGLYEANRNRAPVILIATQIVRQDLGLRPSDPDLDEIAAILNKSEAITIYAGAGCAGAHGLVLVETFHMSRQEAVIPMLLEAWSTPRFVRAAWQAVRGGRRYGGG